MGFGLQGVILERDFEYCLHLVIHLISSNHPQAQPIQACRNLVQRDWQCFYYLDKGLFRIADRPTGIETSPFAGAREINMMSADLRKLSDLRKELEAAEHIPSHKSQAQKAWQVIRQGHYQQQDYVRDVNLKSR
ncbi:unnamed protein product [Withania somnifera]